MENILETHSISKVYGKQRAVDRVSIHIRQGDIYGLIGRNGAGKTTLLKMISNLAVPSEGDYALFGYEGIQRKQVLHRVGTLIEEPGIYPKFSAEKNLKMKCLAMGIRDTACIHELLEIVGLLDAGKKKVGKFSLGMKQRLGIALALVGEPDLVFLDEPINGLDPQGIVEVRETIERLNKEKGITFIISSHILEELSKMATKYGIIHKGSLIQELTKEELLQKCSERISLQTDAISKSVTVLEKMGITEYKVVHEEEIQIFERLQDSGEIVLELAKHNIKILGISVKNEALEKYFLDLTGGNGNA